ncbi:hypothetical protein BVC80_917g20 [Macleaya cordata]|uniref:DEK-C domain-containing protein n=1 Tax=Macleaya cordata TaxID=56857 RepID=A0A200QJ00_MACCD|nr:hypothetical protein BVC80_917g20 [Macleaya cordata]
MEEILHPKEDGTVEVPEVLQTRKEVKASISEDEEKTQGSPVLGLLSGDEKNKHETEDTQSVKSEKAPTENTIKNAIKKRASYFRANSEQVTLVKARRLLEEDLKLNKNSLDPFKKFISAQLDEVLQSPEDTEPANGVKNKHTKKESYSKKSAKVSSEGSSESSESEDEELDEDEVKPKKKTAPKGNGQSSEGLKGRKRPAKETKKSSNKRMKPVEPMSEGSDDANDGGNLSEDSHSQSSAEEPLKKKRDVSTNVYGKRVEHLKSVIKSCGMIVPPSVYKRAKQAPESKREAHLIKELEDILGKEGLSTNPSEKGEQWHQKQLVNVR